MRMSRQPTGTQNTRFFRASRLALLAVTLSLRVHADPGYRDPEFVRLPFAKWLSEGHASQIRWTVAISPAELSTHQRLILRVTARVDGKELEKRRNSGAFEALIEYTDSTGHVWQNHSTIAPEKLQAAMQGQYLDIHFYAFVLPGDYTVSLAVCDPKTFEHSVTVRKVHVNPLKPDPLPYAWSGLPAVDLVPANSDPPNVWFLPELETKLNLPAQPRHALHIRLILNTTPSERSAGSAAALRDNMAVLVPALKALSQIRLNEGTIDTAMLDLTHRKVVFEQNNAASLDWASMRKFFVETKPGIVDIHTLEGQPRMLAFFHDELKKRIAPRVDGCAQLTIVLSGPAFYEDQEAVETAVEPLDPSRQLIYIRYRSVLLPHRYPAGLQGPGRYNRFPARPLMLSPQQSEALIPPLRLDDLEKTAEPFNPRIFDAASASQFRRILAAVMEQIAKM